MRDYEVMIVLDPSLEDEKLEAAIDKIEKLIKNLPAGRQGTKSEVEKIDKWGTRKLSYPIKRFDRGFYLVAHFKSQEDNIKEIERVLQISEEVLRHKIIRRSA